MSLELEIFVATHKLCELPAHRKYIPLHVGKALSGIDLGFQGDDTGENISNLNHSFCECTGLYWISRNIISRYIGLVHYRRHFAAINKGLEFKGQRIASPEDFHEFDQGADLVVATPLGFLNSELGIMTSLESQYFGTGIGQDLLLVREALEELYPTYLYAFDFTMRNCQLTAYNMFVGTQAVTRAYTDWLFPILFTLEKRIPYQFYDAYQKRVFGFIAERLFTVWVNKNRGRYRIATRDVLFIP